MNTRLEDRLTEIPEVPEAVGEDGGHLYRYYDALADEIDEDMVKSLKAQLDGILIYAGLFAGVNSAFLALTLPEMSADPTDDTNALLFHLVTGGNRNITSMDDLPSASFSPASGMFSINILFSLSLTLALLAAFLAVLGQQWLVYYRKNSGGGADAQRWEQLRRYLGARRWRLEAILDDILPSLLQLGLVIFCIAFALYLRKLSPWVCYTVAIPMGLALACILFMAISAAVDQWCPFKSPLSRAFQLIPPSVALPAWHAILSLASFVLIGADKARGMIGRAAGPMIRWAGQAAVKLRSWASGILTRAKDLARTLTNFVIHQGSEKPQESNGPSSSPRNPGSKYASEFVSRVAEKIPRPAEPRPLLNMIVVKRILCTSEDANALIYAAVNLQALKSSGPGEWFLSNEEVYNRLWEAVERCDYGHMSKSLDLRNLPSRVLHSAFIHLVFISGKADLLLGHCHDLQPFPPTLTGDTSFDKAINDLRSRVSAIARPLYNYPREKHFSTIQLGLNLIDFILDPAQAESWNFDRWFRDHAILSEALVREKGSILPSLLAWAVQSFTKVEVKHTHTQPDELNDRTRRHALRTNKEYAAWSLSTARNIVLMYREWKEPFPPHLMWRERSPYRRTDNTRQALELVKEALSTCHLDASKRPSSRVYVSLLRHGQNNGVFDRMSWGEWRTLSAATVIDLCSAFIRQAQQSICHHEFLNQTRDDLAHCLEFLDEFVTEGLSDAIADQQNDEIPRKYAEFLELASEKQRLYKYGKAPWRIMIRLGNVLVSSGRLRRERDEAITEECQKAYRRIESALGDEGFLKLLNHLDFSDNPADPPSIQVM